MAAKGFETGYIVSIQPGDFGFIHPRGNGPCDGVYFRREDLSADLAADFGERLLELFVRFRIMQTPRGPRALEICKGE